MIYLYILLFTKPLEKKEIGHWKRVLLQVYWITEITRFMGLVLYVRFIFGFTSTKIKIEAFSNLFRNPKPNQNNDSGKSSQTNFFGLLSRLVWFCCFLFHLGMITWASLKDKVGNWHIFLSQRTTLLILTNVGIVFGTTGERKENYIYFPSAWNLRSQNKEAKIHVQARQCMF